MPDTGKNEKIKIVMNYAVLIMLMVFFAGTWTFAWFYHVTEIYNSLIIFVALAILFFVNIDIREKIRERDKMLLCLGAAIIIAVINLFLIGSNKGCILILTDFLLMLYLAPNLVLTDRQRKMYEIFFLVMFISWFVYDRVYYYNANTGATVTVFTFFGAFVMLQKLAAGRELYGFFLVISFVRVITLVFWHLARGAFIALALFILFYYVVPKKWWESKKFFNFLVLFSTLGSLLFVAFYVCLGATGFNLKLPFFYKNIFSGREQIWYEVWEILREQLLTGIGSGRELRSFFEYNIHNAMYDILAVHGVIVFILSLILIWNRFKLMRDGMDRNNPGSMCSLAALFAIFIESFIDMDLMWADYSPVILLLLITIYDRRVPGERSGGET